MQVIENLKVKEKLYVEKLENGLTVMIIPKPGIQKKYIIERLSTQKLLLSYCFGGVAEWLKAAVC